MILAPVLRLFFTGCVSLAVWTTSERSHAISFLSFDPSAMGMGDAGTMTGVGGDRPYLNPAVIASPRPITSINAFLGARAIDRQHFIETFEEIEENFESMQLEEKFRGARASFRGGDLDPALLRELATAADQVAEELNKLPNRYIRIAASGGAQVVNKQQAFAVGAFVHHYRVLSGVVQNDPQDLLRIAQLSATAVSLADTIDRSRQVDDLAHGVDWPLIEDLARESVKSGSVDSELVNYQRIPGLQALLDAVDKLEGEIEEVGAAADPTPVRQLARQIDWATVEDAVDRSLDTWVLHEQLRNYEQIPGVTPLIEGLENFGRQLNRLDEHVDLRALAEFVVSESAAEDLNEIETADVDLRQFLRYELPEDINSIIIYSGAEVTETALQFSLMPASLEGFSFGANLKQQEYSTIAFVQRVDDFELDEYEEEHTRRDYRFWNLDLGVSYTVARYWSFGAVVKNVVKKELTTRLGGVVLVEPIARAGVAFGSDAVTLAADVDLTRNEPLGFDGDKQYLSVGAQFRFWQHQVVRLGYKHNMIDQTGIPAVGLGFAFAHGGFDLAATFSEKQSEAGVALQLGVLF